MKRTELSLHDVGQAESSADLELRDTVPASLQFCIAAGQHVQEQRGVPFVFKLPLPSH